MNRSTVSRLNQASLCCGEAKQTSVGAERRDKLSLYNLHIERARACGRAASQATAREAEGGPGGGLWGRGAERRPTQSTLKINDGASRN